MASAATTDNPPNDPNSVVINGDVSVTINLNLNLNFNLNSLSPPPTPLASIININGTCNINYNLNAAVGETADKDLVTMSKVSKWIKPLLNLLVFLLILFAGGSELVLKKEWKSSS